MQSSGQYDNVESTALANEDRAENSDVPKIQRESIRTRRELSLFLSSETSRKEFDANECILCNFHEIVWSRNSHAQFCAGGQIWNYHEEILDPEAHLGKEYVWTCLQHCAQCCIWVRDHTSEGLPKRMPASSIANWNPSKNDLLNSHHRCTQPSACSTATRLARLPLAFFRSG